MGQWRDRVSGMLVDFLLRGMKKKAERRRNEIRDLQSRDGQKPGKVTRILIYEENLHLRDRMDIGTKTMVVRGNGGGWDQVPDSTPPDNTVHVNASTLKAIATGRLDLPMKDGTVKRFAPPEHPFTAADANAWGLFEFEGKTGGLNAMLTFDREVERMFSDLRLYDDHGNYTG